MQWLAETSAESELLLDNPRSFTLFCKILLVIRDMNNYVNVYFKYIHTI